LNLKRAVQYLLSIGADPNMGDQFVNINITAKKLGLNALQGFIFG
jgi:hypothetical protein